MDDTARTEYPAMLPSPAVAQRICSNPSSRPKAFRDADWDLQKASLQPTQAARVLNDRVKRIDKLNVDIADWLQGPWSRVVAGVESMAKSHHILSESLEKDVEQSLRTYAQPRHYPSVHELARNLTTLAKSLEKHNKKADKGTSHIGETPSQQWELQAPHIFEVLQAVDESRIDHLRGVLTRYQTYEAEQVQRAQEITARTLAAVIEINTKDEINDFASRTTAGLPPPPTRSSTRPSSTGGRQPSIDQGLPLPNPNTTRSTLPTNIPPPTGGSASQLSQEDDFNEQLPKEQPKESKLRRLGTLFGRRRQSVHAGFGSLSPSKPGGATFGRLGSSHGRSISPHTSSTNLHDAGRLSSLAETPRHPANAQDEFTNGENRQREGVNGVRTKEGAGAEGANGTRSADLFDTPPLSGPPPFQQIEKPGEPARDSEGYTIRAPMDDPISQAQREAAGEEADQLLRLNIQNQPVEEEDPEAKQAALSNVAKSLQIGPATRRTSAIRGRRDVRNTIYVPPPGLSLSSTDSSLPAISASPPSTGSFLTRPPALNALASEASLAGTSDSQSVRSGHSLRSLVHAKHPAELNGPGLQGSIIETVSAVFVDGTLKRASISGEIAFVNNDADASSKKTHETIRINNFPKLERIGPNRIFVQNASLDQPDQYTLDLSHLSRTSIAFSYKVFAEEADTALLGKHCPILLKPVWKPQDDKLGLLLQYQLHPASSFPCPVALHNVVLVATYDGKASGAQTKPSGTHLKDKHLIYWRLGDVTVTSDVSKIVCRVVGADGTCPAPGHVEARWEYAAAAGDQVGSGISISRPADRSKGKDPSDDDPFADAGAPASPGPAWIDVPAARKLVSGNYEGR
ncbi:hypothetical protein UVI_02019320 [Ustilaginoidea virens]|uniref:Muniscin C-terminal domain-containing protein n=1 Tax=Ustilaginoidea virens TaxID=1159556 RepID=A0A1B5KXF8_USTVR|nr:hypothetical protein UVI_02019320 [Ustilaginoidea virens]